MRVLSSSAALLLVIAVEFLPPALAVFLQDRDVSATSCWVCWACRISQVPVEREQWAQHSQGHSSSQISKKMEKRGMRTPGWLFQCGARFRYKSTEKLILITLKCAV